MPGNKVVLQHGKGQDKVPRRDMGHVIDIAQTDDFQLYADRHKWIGNPVGDRVDYPDGGSMQGYQNATVYRRPGVNNFEHLNVVFGAIRERYNTVGGPTSWLGYPVSDEFDFEGGRASAFERGAIYWWPDTGAIDINQVVISYAGLLCFGETDWDGFSPADEPYVTIGVAAPNSSGEVATFQSQVYGGVDDHEGRRDTIELYRGSPTNVLLDVTVREHDLDDPNKYRAAVQSSLEAAANAAGAVLKAIPLVGTVLSAIGTPILGALADAASDPIYEALDLGDDLIGRDQIVITAKQSILLAAQSVDHTAFGVPMKFESKTLTGDGSTYKVAFGAWKA
ncbi:hypothetical protein [Mycobacterium sp. OAE908]|uniref:LGFP repeat-containing protein n=1 Tax=Mycobacterium sp. OAE908 TaxID=2817899 RepID=UPI001AEB0948